MRRSSAVLPALLAFIGSAACGSSSSDKTCTQTQALRVCPEGGNPVVHGIDVSTYQGTIAWAQVKAAKIDFAFARISDGTTHPDAQFANNWKGMKGAGVVRGSYQYFRASEDPIAQANLVASSLNGAGGLLSGDLPVVMDMETADGQSNAVVQAHMTTWFNAVRQATGRAPIIYTNSASSSFIGSSFGGYSLWVANWGVSCPNVPSGWSTWKFWQYTDMGSVPGISGAVDLDEFDGTLADLTSSIGGGGTDGGGGGAATVDSGSSGIARGTRWRGGSEWHTRRRGLDRRRRRRRERVDRARRGVHDGRRAVGRIGRRADVPSVSPLPRSRRRVTVGKTVKVISPEEVGLSSAGLRRIDEHLEGKYIAQNKVAGALTLVARRGEVAFLSPLGQMDRERAKPMLKDTIFRIYSMTKPITSVALMMLHERGVFQLADPVHKWIPSWEQLRVYRYGRYPNFTTAPADRPMTVRDLLTHMSGLSYGIVERTHVDAAYRKLGVGDGKGTLRDMVDKLSQLPLEFSPGTRWGYSVATDVIGHLIELMSGRRFDEYLQEEIFQPLGMIDTGFTVPADNVGRFAANYARTADRQTVLFDDPIDSAYTRPKTFFSGGSGLVSTAADYFRFAEMLRRGGELDGARILGPRTIKYMTSNHLPNGGDLAAHATGSFAETRYEGVGFGLGFHVTLDPVRAQVPSSVGEYGWGGMASTAFWNDPVEDLTVIFMTQLMPSTAFNFRGQLKSMVYGAIVS
jgi:CubicO group peptidase (beta-lactamase class C family)/GH25 family lysozyme M1 (1,4-beta-N-acetylmuramidase)